MLNNLSKEEQMALDFGSKLRKLRRAQQLTQKDLAEKIGVSTRTVINYEQGRCLPKQAQVIGLLADEFNVSADYLLSERQNPPELESFNWSGVYGKAAVEELVSRLTTLFAGGYLNENDRDAAMEAITQAYWESRRAERSDSEEPGQES
ncbi:MAG: helix-turn-helix transcriptional regulator [Eubacteriales bacterium]|nr:helix-turn-helix transcriptional regulator [Eubacteriales bacterium]